VTWYCWCTAAWYRVGIRISEDLTSRGGSICAEIMNHMTPLFLETNTAAGQEKVPFQLARSLPCTLNQVQVLPMNKHELKRRIVKSKRTAAKEQANSSSRKKSTLTAAVGKEEAKSPLFHPRLLGRFCCRVPPKSRIPA